MNRSIVIKYLAPAMLMLFTGNAYAACNQSNINGTWDIYSALFAFTGPIIGTGTITDGGHYEFDAFAAENGAFIVPLTIQEVTPLLVSKTCDVSGTILMHWQTGANTDFQLVVKGTLDRGHTVFIFQSIERPGAENRFMTAWLLKK
jgi:hypothetical protein